MVAIAKKNFVWIRGEDFLKSYSAPSGYYAVFCSKCGSPLPKTRWNKLYLVPVGTLDDDPDINSKIHIHVASKAPWHEILDDYPKFEQNPPSEKP